MSTFEERWCGRFIDKSVVIACSAGVLLVLANLTSLPLFIHPAMFDLKLEWVVGAGGRGRAKRCLPKDTTSKPPPPPWYKFISLPSAAIKRKDGGPNFLSRKYWAFSHQNYTCSTGQCCKGIYETALKSPGRGVEGVLRLESEEHIGKKTCVGGFPRHFLQLKIDLSAQDCTFPLWLSTLSLNVSSRL